MSKDRRLGRGLGSAAGYCGRTDGWAWSELKISPHAPGYEVPSSPIDAGESFAVSHPQSGEAEACSAAERL